MQKKKYRNAEENVGVQEETFSLVYFPLPLLTAFKLLLFSSNYYLDFYLIPNKFSYPIVLF